MNTTEHRTTLRPTLIAVAALVACLLVIAIGCGSDEESSVQDTAGDFEVGSPEWKAEQIKWMQASIDEAVERFKYHDKAALYDMEFEYLQTRVTFDEYLEFANIKNFNPDTLDRIIIKDARFVGDTAWAEVDVRFVGPSGEPSYDHDVYPFYLHRGRWIRPTATSTPAAIAVQREFEAAVRAADSAAAAEEAEGL